MPFRIAMISRSTLFTVPGGDTVQIVNTANELKKLGYQVEVLTTDQKVDYSRYELLHFFNITRPIDILPHVERSNKPYVLTPIFVDYSEFDLQHRKGLSGWIIRRVGRNKSEALKSFARKLKGQEKNFYPRYWLKGYHWCMQEVLENAAFILPNSNSERKRLAAQFDVSRPQRIIYNGIDHRFWQQLLEAAAPSARNRVLCVGRIEGIKNQRQLVNAARNEPFKLQLVGKPAPNQAAYYRQCQAEAGANTEFINHCSQQELAAYYLAARVHVLPSWFETTGLSSLEAAFMGCNIVVTDKGDTREYFGDYALYADPGSVLSIQEKINEAYNRAYDPGFRQHILDHFTWEKTAARVSEVYHEILSKN